MVHSLSLSSNQVFRAAVLMTAGGCNEDETKEACEVVGVESTETV